MDQEKDPESFKGRGSLECYYVRHLNGGKREVLRRATLRAKKYPARAEENLKLADSALIQQVRDHH